MKQAMSNFISKMYFRSKLRYLPGFNQSRSFEEWDKWIAQTKSDRPVAYFIYNLVDRLITKIRWILRDIKWFFLHRFAKKHRYNIIDTKLKPNYYDIDTRMLYGCFSLLEEFVQANAESIHHDFLVKNRNPNIIFIEETHKSSEIEALIQQINYYTCNNLINHADKYKEILELYMWWTEKKYNKNEDDNKFYEMSDEEYAKYTQEISDKEQEMLIRLIKIRQFLWN